MSDRDEVRAFLLSRRARAGVETFGGRRRVEGLRRDEVARLAGVSVDYDNSLERGNLRGVSEPVLQAVARALRLDQAEIDHLFNLARAASSPRWPDPSRTEADHDAGARVLSLAAAEIENGRWLADDEAQRWRAEQFYQRAVHAYTTMLPALSVIGMRDGSEAAFGRGYHAVSKRGHPHGTREAQLVGEFVRRLRLPTILFRHEREA